MANHTYTGTPFTGAQGDPKVLAVVARIGLVDDLFIWIVLDHREPYADLGVDYFDRRGTEAVKRRASKRLADLGYHGTYSPRYNPLSPCGRVV